MRLFLVTLIWCVQGAWAAYRESLAVLPLPSSGVPLHRLRWHFNQTQELPRDLQELVQEFPDMESLQWSMTQGRWNWKWSVAEDWAPSGLQVRVQWQQPSSSSTSNHEMLQQHWLRLLHRLSGMFCASMAFMVDQARTVQLMVDGHSVWMAQLPVETVCTENLTPWLNMLPCPRSGLASLIHPYRVYSARYHSMQFRLFQTCEKVGKCVWAVEQTFTAILPLSKTGTLMEWVGKPLESRCTVAQSSDLILQGEKDESVDLLWPRFWKRNHTLSEQSPVKADVRFHRWWAGIGQQFSGWRWNALSKQGTTLHVVEVLPWFLRLYVHTLKCDHSEPYRLQYRPAIDRERPHLLQFYIDLHPNKEVRCEMHAEKTLLRYTEYPPDANRGLDCGSSIALLHDKNDGKTKWMFTSNQILRFPTPDFSMPYNVITLTSTVMALCFGSLFNLMVRHFAEEKYKKNLFQTLMGKFRRRK